MDDLVTTHVDGQTLYGDMSYVFLAAKVTELHARRADRQALGKALLPYLRLHAVDEDLPADDRARLLARGVRAFDPAAQRFDTPEDALAALEALCAH